MARSYFKTIGIAVAVMVLLAGAAQAGLLYFEPAYPGDIYAEVNDIITYDLIYDPGIDGAFNLIGFDYDFGFDSQELAYVSASSSRIAIDEMMSGETDPGALWLVGMDVVSGYQFISETPATVLSIDFRVISPAISDAASDCWLLEQDPLLYKGMMDDLGGMHSFGAVYGADVAVPEPGTVALLAIGGLLAITRWRR
ncbi:MAG: PEP-CTERM sorting domain-containing protein [Planctomycetes bacterium]|nr:PEP-CTERM sorting domain-containing protein [Planctomycetota bacterium]